MQIALLIDADNISHRYAEKIFNNLEGIGMIKIAKIFGRASSLKGWEGIAKKYKIEIQKHQNENKNSTDFSMTISAIEILSRYHHLEAFCIVSGDRDFLHLITKLKEEQKYIIGMAGNNAAKNIKNQCDKFFELNAKQSKQANTKSNKQKINSNTELVSLIKETINRKSKNNQFVRLQIITAILGNEPNNLKAKNYGYKSWRDLFYDLDFIHTTTDDSNQVLVKINEKNKSKPANKSSKSRIQQSYVGGYYGSDGRAYYGLSEWSQFMSDITGIVGDWDWYDD